MSAQTFLIRLFGGRDLAVAFDSGAGTISILGQSISIASLPAALQAQWEAAIGGAISGIGLGPRPAFGGDNISATVGAILDNQSSWRSAVTAALVLFVEEQTLNGQVASVETFNR
jgi:hypothetical protein